MGNRILREGECEENKKSAYLSRLQTPKSGGIY